MESEGVSKEIRGISREQVPRRFLGFSRKLRRGSQEVPRRFPGGSREVPGRFRLTCRAWRTREMAAHCLGVFFYPALPNGHQIVADAKSPAGSVQRQAATFRTPATAPCGDRRCWTHREAGNIFRKISKAIGTKRNNLGDPRNPAT